jgi:chloramphenicol 3-O phosphotransferase
MRRVRDDPRQQAAAAASPAAPAAASAAAAAPGRIVLLNGTSSAGKTTLALAFQHLRRDPWHYVALDQYRDGMPGLYRGMNAPAGTPGHAGMNVVPVQRDGVAVTEVRLGEVGVTMLRGMHRAIAAFARAGNNTVVDDLILEPSLLDDYVEALAGLDVLFVGVFCDPDVLAARERKRLGRFPGTAVAHLESAHAHDTYDLRLDTTHQGAADCARVLSQRIDDAAPATAFATLRARRQRGAGE